MPAVTLKDIAKKAGVSHVTVSHALKGRDVVRDSTRQRIEQVALDMGYRLNAAARATREGRTGTVAMVLSTNRRRSHIPAGLMLAIHDELQRRDLHLTIARLPDQQLADEGFVPKILRETAADGLLINYTHAAPPVMLELIERHAIPSIWINVLKDTDCVYPDDFDAAVKATTFLLNRHHRHIAYLDWSSNDRIMDQHHFSSPQRRAGYEHAMRSAGLAPRVYQRDVAGPDRYAAISAILNEPSTPDAWVCYGGHEVNALMLASCQQGENPTQLPCITFGAQVYDAMGFTIPTVLLPEQQMGKTAVQMLVEKIDQPLRTLPASKLCYDAPLDS